MSKPDWKDAPEWAQWLAQDLSGVWVWFSGGKPFPYGSMWRPTSEGQGFQCKRATEDGLNMDWRSTLEQRP